ncbi:DNA repair protein RecO [Christensenella timonensis]|uniref:DNA repair protein RecO n=1 Tax=Christensenella timonensis TaxID=1816678 RepID=UPI0008377DA1|nr:DNA repair protein RecO [Christensenella timonensis]
MEKHYCIVLRSTDYKDYDKILTLFSRTGGRINAQARGARKIKSEVASASQVLSCGEYEFYKKGDKLFLTNALLRQEFFRVQNDYDAYSAACVMLELADKLLQHTTEYEDLFLTLIYALYAMETAQLLPMQSLAYFFARITSLMGIFPSIGECATCGGEAASDPACFSLAEGGEVCASCAPHVRTIKVPRSVLQNMCVLSGLKPKQVSEAQTKGEDAKGIVLLLSKYLDSMMEIHLKTMKFLNENSL